MTALHPAAELAPRDVVARGIALQMAAQGGQPVLLDATQLDARHGAGFLAHRFPTIDAACQARGLDWARVPIPVTPAAHYWMGGIRTDLNGRTSIPGLMAFGETACTGVHGANRLASNSLLESLVFAARAADLLLSHPSAAISPAEFDATPVRSLPYDQNAVILSEAQHHQSPVILSEAQRSRRTCISAEPGTPVEPVSTAAVNPHTRRALQTLMWQAAGIERNAHDLRAALTQIHPTLAATTDVAARETANLAQLGHALLTAALTREESRGAHFRDDFPTPAPAWAHPLIYSQGSRQAGFEAVHRPFADAAAANR